MNPSNSISTIPNLIHLYQLPLPPNAFNRLPSLDHLHLENISLLCVIPKLNQREKIRHKYSIPTGLDVCTQMGRVPTHPLAPSVFQPHQNS